MNIFPAIDLIDGCAVRLYKGDYSKKTVYSDNPVDVARSFARAGAEYIHIVDLDGAKDGKVAVKGWTELSQYDCFEFCERLQTLGVKTVICTDISKDGAMSGTNIELYRQLTEKYTMDIVASGGVSDIENVRKLTEMDMYGAILGKALYTGSIDLKQAIEIAKGGKA